MVEGHAVFKAQKLLKVNLWHDGGRIEKIQVHGDFFLHPEEKITELESALIGVALDRAALYAAISSFLGTATAFGFGAADLASAILQAGGKNQ
ncbi:MAG: lipoate protein ligase C-terminal domain-containing protein [Candidatus Micrarchaeota archaeon]|nr:lipoate protein ligase C-terminal domain-containing protein [Candidatus Micrarchaeota archaeon]